MRQSNQTLQDLAIRMTTRFGKIVRETHGLTAEQMLKALEDAKRAGEPVSVPRKEKTLQRLNEIYCAL